jgi:N-methylhydantoinase B
VIVDGMVDPDATVRLRTQVRAARPDDVPFFDRGPGYLRLAGRPAADYDWLNDPAS